VGADVEIVLDFFGGLFCAPLFLLVAYPFLALLFYPF
jgi:hypothetical protein